MSKQLTRTSDVVSSSPSPGRRVPEPVSRVVSRSPHFVSIYANDIQVQTSAWDLRLVLAEMADALSPNSVSIVELAELRMSPQLAKRVTLVLMHQLKAYEELYGNIPSPDEELLKG